MKKTKHFNISVPELGDVPDITQVSNAISDLEDATAGTLEIMKAEMQGTKITLTSVSRKTKRTGYYEGMSIRFKSPQDIEPNYLKTISVDGLGDQTSSVGYKVNRNEYIDIVYEGNKFTAYPVVVQKTDSVSENSSILVGTAKGVKTAYDKGVEALNKANQAQSSANNAQSTADGKVSKSGDTMTGSLIIKTQEANQIQLYRQGEKIGELVGGRNYIGIYTSGNDFTHKFMSNGTVKIQDKTLTTSNKEYTSAINELNSGKVSKSGDRINGTLSINTSGMNQLKILSNGTTVGELVANSEAISLFNSASSNFAALYNNGNAIIKANNLKTSNKEVIEAINELYYGKVNKNGDAMTGPLSIDAWNNNLKLLSKGVNKGEVIAIDDGIALWNATTRNKIFLRDDGYLFATANNLTTKNKDLVSAINELKNRFNNPSILWQNNSSSDVRELVATGLSKYRIIMMKYVLGRGVDSEQVGSDIHTEMVYITDDNPNFHINGFGSNRVRYHISGDTLTQTFKDDQHFILRRVYGLIEK